MCRLVRDRAGTDRVCTHNDNNPRWLTLSHTKGTIRSVEGLRGERERGRAEPSASPRGGSKDFSMEELENGSFEVNLMPTAWYGDDLG